MLWVYPDSCCYRLTAVARQQRHRFPREQMRGLRDDCREHNSSEHLEEQPYVKERELSGRGIHVSVADLLRSKFSVEKI